MLKLSNINTIKELMAKHNMTFSKGLGQNFLINPSVCPKMADSAVTNKDLCVLEIGAGIGVLTKELAQRAKKVVCIELDKRLLPILDETLAEFDNIKIINGDALKIDLQKLFEEEFKGEQVCVCANLPYYISSPIIMRLLEEKLPITTITVMLQKEMAQRICAKPATRAVGAISLSICYYASASILFNVSKGSFMPPPKIDSSVVQLTLNKQPPPNLLSEKTFFKVIKTSFSSRRKTLVNLLSSGFDTDKDTIRCFLRSIGVSETARAEELTLENFIDLSNCIEEAYYD